MRGCDVPLVFLRVQHRATEQMAPRHFGPDGAAVAAAGEDKLVERQNLRLAIGARDVQIPAVIGGIAEYLGYRGAESNVRVELEVLGVGGEVIGSLGAAEVDRRVWRTNASGHFDGLTYRTVGGATSGRRPASAKGEGHEVKLTLGNGEIAECGLTTPGNISTALFRPVAERGTTYDELAAVAHGLVGDGRVGGVGAEGPEPADVVAPLKGHGVEALFA